MGSRKRPVQMQETETCSAHNETSSNGKARRTDLLAPMVRRV